MAYAFSNIRLNTTDAANWFHARFAEHWTVLQTPNFASMASGNANIDYTSGVYAFKDGAQADFPLALRVLYGAGNYGTNLRLGFCLGAWVNGAFSAQTPVMYDNSSIDISSEGSAVALHAAGGAVFMRKNSDYFSTWRLGRLRTRAGAARDGVLLDCQGSNSPQSALYFPAGGYSLGAARCAFAPPSTLRPVGTAEPALMAEPFMVGGGLLDPDLTPWEFLSAAPLDWAAQQRRKLIFGGAYEFVAPLPVISGTPFSQGSMRWICPLEVPS